MEPINYSAQLAAQPDILGGITKGLQFGEAYRQLQAQRNMQEQYRNDIMELSKNPTPDAILQMMSKHPEQATKFKPMFDALNDKEKQAKLSSGNQIFSALYNDNVPLAKKMLTDKITAYENSGKDASGLKYISQILDNDPKTAQTIIGTELASIDDKFGENFAKLKKDEREQANQPFELREKKAKAGTAESEQTIKAEEAKMAPEKVQAEYNKLLAETNKLVQEPEFERQKIAIARQKNLIDNESNNIARQTKQLQLIKMQQDFNDKVNDKKAKVYSAYDNTINAKNTIDKALSFFKTGDAQRAHGTIAGKYIPTVRQGTKDYEKTLETIGSQSFLKAIQEVGGMSGLTEIEGQKLQSAAVNLSLEQGDKQAKQNLILLKNLLTKSLKNVETRYGISTKKARATDRSSMSGADAASALGI